ncbi:hypothetical protein N9C30_00305 [bacterium]|nr:hypothetical protein [bacterium]
MSKRLVLIVESPFSLRDRRRFGVDQLRALGFSVQIWEVCDWILPRSREQWLEDPGDIEVHSISTSVEFRKLTQTLTDNDSVILIGVVRFPIGPEREALLECLFDTSSRIGSVVVGNLPSPSRGWDLRQQLHRYLSLVRASLRGVRKFRRGLDYVWGDTSIRTVDRRVLTSSSDVHYVHALDYDLVSAVNREPAESPYALILDSMGPRHPDWQTLGIGNPWPKGCYEATARALIKELTARGFQVIVAAHPRAAPGTIEHLYEGADVQYGNTPELLAAASFALTLEGSTSLGMAAVLRVPIIFVEAECQPEYTRMMVASFCRAFKSRPHSVASVATLTLPPVVDSNVYEKYVRDFVKRPDTPEGDFWLIVGNHLLRSER